MAIDFPDSPSVNDLFTVGSRTWQWDGVAWSLSPSTGISSVTATDVTASGDLTVSGATTLAGLTASGDVTFDTDTLHVDSTNDRVGIGTTSPESILHLNPGTDVTPDANGLGHIMIDGNTYTSFFTMDGDATWVGNNSNARAVYLATDETARLAVTGTGDIGIGTTAPDGEFELTANVSQMIFSSSPNKTNRYRLDANISDSADFGFSLGYWDGSAWQRTLTIDDSGNVGIGTTSPSAELEVASTSPQVTFTDTDGVASGTINSLLHFDHATGTAGQVGFGTTSGNMISWSIGGHYYSGSQYASGNHYFRAGGSDKMALLSSGNVGIGTLSPETPLHIVTANTLGSTFTGTTDGEGVRVDQSSYTADDYVSLIEASYNSAQTAPHVRIGAQFTGSGSNLVFGTTNTYGSGITNAALVIDPTGNLLPSGHIYGTASSNFFVGNNFNERVLFQESSNTIFFMTDNTYRARVESTGVSPYLDNTQDLGQSGRRWDDVYATNGTIQTSDQRDKKDITDLDLGLDFVNALRPVSFVWDDRGGHVGTREHMGFLAQEVASTLGDQAYDRAVWIDAPAGTSKNADGEVEESPDRQGLRYEELIAPMVKAIQELTAQNAELVARIEALEA